MTKSLQTISLWTECAEESIRTGNLIKWTVRLAFLSLHYKGYTVTSDVRSSNIYGI